MSVDTICYLSHSLDLKSIPFVIESWNSRGFPAEAGEVMKMYRRLTVYQCEDVTRWEMDTESSLDFPNQVWVVGPDPLFLGFSDRCCKVDTFIKDIFYHKDSQIRLAVRRLYFAMARELGSPFAIYAPDGLFPPAEMEDYFFKGLSLSEMLEKGRREIGEPKINPRTFDVDQENENAEEVNFWSVDDFEDFKQET